MTNKKLEISESEKRNFRNSELYKSITLLEAGVLAMLSMNQNFSYLEKDKLIKTLNGNALDIANALVGIDKYPRYEIMIAVQFFKDFAEIQKKII